MGNPGSFTGGKMEFGGPPLARFKYPIVAIASLVAAYGFFQIATVSGWGILGALAFAVGAFVVFGFIQGLLPIANLVGLPIASYFIESMGTWGYWLGGISLLVFVLTQFHHVRSVD